MAIVAFVVLFSAVVSSVIASATTSLLLSYILPVSLPGPASQIPDRIAGWGMAAGASVIAIAVLWPAATRDPIRVKAIAGCRAIAARLRSEIAFIVARGAEEAVPDYRVAIAAADDAITDLYRTFLQTPYRPTGLTTSDRAVVRLVDNLRWCNGIVLHAQAAAHPHVHTLNPRVIAVKQVRLGGAGSLCRFVVVAPWSELDRWTRRWRRCTRRWLRSRPRRRASCPRRCARAARSTRCRTGSSARSIRASARRS